MDLVNKIITRRLDTYIAKENKELELFEYEHKPMSWSQWQSWYPTEEDIPSLVESIKYWGMIGQPQKPRDQWSPIEKKIYIECKKKEIILYELLGRVDDSWWKKPKTKLPNIHS
jgi:hypothetical protein